MSLPQNLSICFEFFHKIPTNVITMYPVSSFQKTHKELTLLLNFRVKCEFFVSFFKRTHWVHCDCIGGYFVKELKTNAQILE